MTYIAVAAPSDIVYVAGTINGVATTFHMREGDDKWYGNAPAVEDSTYNLWVEMYDAAGNRSEYTTTLVYDLPWFVTDRTIADVENRTQKGLVNARDLNRIEKNNYTIGGLATLIVDAKYDWIVGQIPRASDYLRIRQGVQKLRNYAHRATTPEVPNSPLNSFEKYNAIEQIQKDCYDIYVGNKKNYAYAGEFYAGEGGLI